MVSHGHQFRFYQHHRSSLGLEGEIHGLTCFPRADSHLICCNTTTIPLCGTVYSTIIHTMPSLCQHACTKEARSIHLPHPVSGRVPEIKPKLEKVKVALNVCCCLLLSINQPPNDHQWLLIRGTDTLPVSFTCSVLYTYLSPICQQCGRTCFGQL